jgi:bla regulator protein BlaR1
MDAVANHLWQSTVFAAAAGLLAWTCRANSASVRHWIWFAAAVKFLVPFAALAAVANRIPLPQSPQRASEVFEAAAVVFSSSALPAIPVGASTPIVLVWLSGAFLVLAGWLRQSHRLAVRARRSPPIVDGVVHDTLRRIEREEHISTPTAIVAANHSIEPGVLGIRTPVLLWPAHLTTGLSHAHIEAIVAHEVCHIVRRDNLLALVQIAVTAAFWFHPLVWWIGKRLVDERERACDERVLARGRPPGTYAESILETCRLCIASPLVNVSGVTGGDLKRRIVRIVKHVPVAPFGVPKKIALGLAVLLTVFVPILGGAGSRVATAAAAQQPDRPGGRVTMPKLKREVKPQYSERAKQEKIEGEVLMECVVNADGTVGNIKVVKSLHPDLDQAAMDAAAQWLFEPGTRDGKPVDVIVTIAMSFTLKN